MEYLGNDTKKQLIRDFARQILDETSPGVALLIDRRQTSMASG
jgi:hypothetical protein